jgi:hypothetical protein
MNATEPRLDQPAEQGTGCVSVSCDPHIELVKICEAFDADNGTLWIDLYLNHRSDEPGDDQYVDLLHRGRLFAKNVTGQSGFRPRAQDLNYRDPASLSWRLRELHRLYEPLRFLEDNNAELEGDVYDAVTEDALVATVLLDELSDEGDKPFTLWRIGPFPSATEEADRKYWVRLEMQMSDETKMVQLGPEFPAYGEGILLALITYDDLPRFRKKASGDEYLNYENKLKRFVEGNAIPRTYEYVVIGPTDQRLGWVTEPRSALLSPLPILDDQLERSTIWYVIDNSLNAPDEKSPLSWFSIGFLKRAPTTEIDQRDSQAVKAQEAVSG